ncbi:MAG: MFS transporter [Simkania sp.]|nr:MFS transporter [Simkania sp.]
MLNSFFPSRFTRFRQHHSLTLMNLAQFGAIVNDNIYKLVVVFLLIDTLGTSQASTILSKAGTIFGIPFLLFSSAAGILADRFSKKWILAAMKMVEVCIFLAAIPIFLIKSPFACFFLLFLLATHSAVFGPSKYGIIPELVDNAVVPKANGLITSTTYLAIIIGTFLGSFLTQITGRNFTLVMGFCCVFSILGLFCALAIPRTPQQGSLKKFSPLFLIEIYQTLNACKHYRHLRIALFGSAFFLFLGSYTQLSIIPYTIESLGLPEEVGGYLFLCTALGIAIGAFLAGKLQKKTANLLIPCAASYSLCIFLGALYVFSGHLFLVAISLTLLGASGGLFIVPFDSFIQLSCPSEHRGQIIGACNFLGFCGVLIASFCLYYFSKVLSLHIATSFGVIAGLTLLFALGLCLRLSDLVARCIAKRLFQCDVHLHNAPLLTGIKDPPLLILQHATWKKFFAFSLIAPDYHFILFNKTTLFYRCLAKLCYHLHVAPASPKELLQAAELLQAKGYAVCIILPYVISFEEAKAPKTILDFFKSSSPERLYVDIQLPLSHHGSTEITFSKE